MKHKLLTFIAALLVVNAVLVGVSYITGDGTPTAQAQGKLRRLTTDEYILLNQPGASGRLYLGSIELPWTYMSYIDLSGANLGGAILDGAMLGGASLKNATVWGASLDGAYLGGADLQGATFHDASFRNADLEDASLAGAFLVAADLTGANLKGANLEGALYDETTKWPAGFDVEASGAELYEE